MTDTTIETEGVDAEPSTLDVVVQILTGQLQWPVAPAACGPETSVGADGLGLDSLMVVELALDLEDEFGIEIDEDDMLAMGGMTLGQIAECVDACARRPGPVTPGPTTTANKGPTAGPPA